MVKAYKSLNYSELRKLLNDYRLAYCVSRSDSLAHLGCLPYDTLTQCAVLAWVENLILASVMVCFERILTEGTKKPPTTEVEGGKIWMLQQLEAEAKTGHYACIVVC